MESKPVWRHEEKIPVSTSDRVLLISRLTAAMMADSHCGDDGTYTIRSIYFDDLYRTALNDSLAGVPVKTKYRIRMYNSDPSVIFLEKKTKKYDGGQKLRCPLSADDVRKIIGGDYGFLLNKDNALCREFYARLVSGLRPAVTVDYRRAAFYSPQGNVRITLDDSIYSSATVTDFFGTEFCGTPLNSESSCILEVKYDRFLPDHIRKLIGLKPWRKTGFSKYTLGRNIF